MIPINIPAGAEYIIEALETEGYEAWVVGGCVRDSLMGKEPKDWDICTSALPEQYLKCFSNNKVIETGLKHGTITILINNIPYELTTFRIDNEYSDNRHPDGVEFIDSLKGDLARRDFTINAMAYNARNGLVDFFGGAEDLGKGIIKCVGEPDKRFREDALRIMRALRFAATLGFKIDKSTSTAMKKNKELLNNIAVERIAAELSALIIGNNIYELFSENMQVILEIIPELKASIGFDQNNIHHCYDVLTHTLHSVDSAKADLHVRLCMLFHDIGKPMCYSEINGTGHFYGHTQLSADMTRKILRRLKYDNETVSIVTQLVLYHDVKVAPKSRFIKRWLNRIGEQRLRQLIEVNRADVMAQDPYYRDDRLKQLEEAQLLIDEIIKQQQCFSIKDLAVNGSDLIDIGIIEGYEIGLILNRLVYMVIDEEIENEKDQLIHAAKQLSKQSK